MTDYGYRPAVGVMLLNREGKAFVGQRLDSTLEAWQMPQGGLDPGETPREGALSRARGGDRHRAATWSRSSPAARPSFITTCPKI